MKKDFVSVAVCTYNGELYIEEQLNSILHQTVPVDEIVIGDDGSEDGTIIKAEKILSAGNISYKIIKNEKNLGYRKNFENVILNTRGNIIFLCDQDDVWLENKVDVMLRHFESNSKCLLVFSDGYLVDETLAELPLSLWEAVYYNKKKIEAASWWELFLGGYYVTGAAMAVRRELFDKAYPFSDIWQHDGWLAVYASVFGEIEEEPFKLIKYRQHGKNQIGADSNRTLRAQIKKKKEIIKKGAAVQKEGHDFMYKRYIELMHRCGENLDKEKKKQLKEVVVFGRKMKALSNRKRIKSIRIIMNCWKHGDYKRYCKKSLGTMLGDLIFLFVP